MTFCGQRLFEDGKPIAVCTQPWGLEHDHSQTVDEAILLGLAEELPGCDYCGEDKVTHVLPFVGTCDDCRHVAKKEGVL